MKYRSLWYGLSLLFIVPGTIALLLWGLKPSIDFTGGSKWELAGTQDVVKITKFATDNGLQGVTVQKIEGDSLSLRFKEINETKHAEVLTALKKSFKEEVKESSFETVGPAMSAELTRNAFIAVALASLIIIIYIAYSFRKVPYPAKSWEFGVGAVVSTLHDALLLVGIFAIMGHYFGVEVDPLIVTAILTVIGFSVHDTIVIYDRIRENLIRSKGTDFEDTVNLSVVEMLSRTLNTSYLAWIILFILFISGGSTIRWFSFALMVGIASGTYSSILNASPLLVTWDDFKEKRKNRPKKR